MNVLLVLAIVIATIVGATSGRMAVSSYLALLGMRGDEARVLGMILGGTVGFVAAAIPAVVVFALTEIVNNTRQTLLETRRSNLHPRFDEAAAHREQVP